MQQDDACPYEANRAVGIGVCGVCPFSLSTSLGMCLYIARCIDRWLEDHTSCCVCKADMEEMARAARKPSRRRSSRESCRHYYRCSGTTPTKVTRPSKSPSGDGGNLYDNSRSQQAVVTVHPVQALVS